MAIFCNQRTRINMAWRDDCTKHKPKTGGMSTKFGEAKKSSLSPTKRLRINLPRGPGLGFQRYWTIWWRRPVSSLKKTLNHNEIFVPHQPNVYGLPSGQQCSTVFHKVRDEPNVRGCAPKRPETRIPAILDDLVEASTKRLRINPHIHLDVPQEAMGQGFQRYGTI